LFEFWGEVTQVEEGLYGRERGDVFLEDIQQNQNTPALESIESMQPLEEMKHSTPSLENSERSTQPLEGTLHSIHTLEDVELSIQPLEKGHSLEGSGKSTNSLDGIKQLTQGIKQSTQPLESRRKSTQLLHPIITTGHSTASMINHQKLSKINAREKIMRKKFGQVPLENPTSPPLPKKEKEKPFYMQYDYEVSDIVFDADGSIKSATIEVLIERLTLQDATDFEYQRRFLLTYKTFMTSNALFEALATRFSLEAPRHLNTEEVLLWHERKQYPIKTRYIFYIFI
jgi:hypothetical protein